MIDEKEKEQTLEWVRTLRRHQGREDGVKGAAESSKGERNGKRRGGGWSAGAAQEGEKDSDSDLDTVFTI
jgi:hypothetical protein